MDTFGQRLRAVRRKEGLSQREMAEKLGVSGNHYGRYETERAAPPYTVLAKLKELYRVDLDWLISGIGDAYAESDILGVADFAGKYETELARLRRENDSLRQTLLRLASATPPSADLLQLVQDAMAILAQVERMLKIGVSKSEREGEK